MNLVTVNSYHTSVFPERDTLQPCQVKTAIFEPGPNEYFLFLLSSEPNISANPERSSSCTRSPASTSNRSSVSFSRSKRVPVLALAAPLAAPAPSSADFSGPSVVMAVEGEQWRWLRLFQFNLGENLILNTIIKKKII